MVIFDIRFVRFVIGFARKAKRSCIVNFRFISFDNVFFYK